VHGAKKSYLHEAMIGALFNKILYTLDMHNKCYKFILGHGARNICCQDLPLGHYLNGGNLRGGKRARKENHGN